MNRILIIQTAFLGDVILATPVASELKRLFPNAAIDFVVKKGNESLLLNHPDIHEVFVFDKANGKYRSMIRLIRLFRRTKYDLTVNLHRFASSGLLSGLSGASKRFGFDKNPFSFLYTQKFDHTIGDGTHEVSRNLALIAEFGAVDIARPSLYPSPEDFEKIVEYQDTSYICIAPASVWTTKQLPVAKWVELVAKNSTVRTYILGAPSDIDLGEEIRAQLPHLDVVNLCGKLSLLQSAALMKGAVRNYVNDSGPLHLASSVNAPVTAFFCSTVPAFGFGPLSEDSDVKEVLHLDCRPCGLHGHKSCPRGNFRCGDNMEL